MSVDVNQAKSIFLAVLEMPGHERASFLDAQCGSDDSLRRKIEAMLQAHANSGELLPRPAAEMLDSADVTGADATSAFDSPTEPPRTEPGVAGADDLTFLGPATKPGTIGRLGHYEILEVVGKGGFGVVLKAFDEKLHRVLAIKVLAPAFAANGSARKRFVREARTAAAVKNEHVVGIYDVEAEAHPPYLAMEMVEGISLQDKLDKHGPLGVKEILRIGTQMAEGLAAAHKQGLVHRDIKPANVLLENGVERVKITDFGLARAVDDASVTQSGVVAGTPMYMSPEQAEGLAVDHRSDLFSLGTVLYAMCTGHSPFRASGTHAVLKRVIDASPRPIREINNEVPDWLCDIIAKLHAKKPEERFQTAKEVAELLGQHLAHLQQPGQVALPPRLTTPAPAVNGQRKTLAAIPTRVWYGAGLAAFGLELYLLGMSLREDVWDLRAILLMGHALFACVVLALCGLFFALRRRARHRGALRLAQAAILCGVVSTACAVALVGISLTGRAVGVVKAVSKESPLTDDEKLLQGVWIVESGVLDGKPLPEADIKNGRIVFRGKSVQISANLLILDTTYELDSTRVPKRISIASAFPTVFGQKTKEIANGRHGIFSIDGDTLTLCTGPADGPYPTKFEAPSGSPFSLYIWRREGSRTSPLRAEVPPLAVAPFDAARAKDHQEAWAKHLGVDVEITDSIGMKMRLIPPGKFLMGSPDGELDREPHEGPQHDVTVTKPYRMGVHDVTVGQFKAFVTAKGYQTEAEKGDGADRLFPDGNWRRDRQANWQNPGFEQTDDHPVVSVSWNDAKAFCDWLSDKEGKQYVLPTEAQWEYGCRAGSQTRFYFGDRDHELDQHAWYSANSQRKSHAVGFKKPNAGGLCDMHGNVGQWTADWYAHDYYQESPKEDPSGPRAGVNRVLRGGDWNNPAHVLRDAYRYGGFAPSFRLPCVGFRVAIIGDLRPKPPPLAVAPQTPSAEPGWVALFNGKDLTGWKTLPGKPADWKVEGGQLVGRSLPGSWLFSASGGYEDFHLRAEVKLNATGNSGVFFRTKFEDFPIDAVPGYEADLSFVEGTPSSPIGSLWKDAKRIQRALKSTAAPDRWFTLEVLARRPRIQVLVNGQTVADYTDPAQGYRKGHIALQALEENTVVHFRNIEIKEMPSQPAAKTVAPAAQDLANFSGPKDKLHIYILVGQSNMSGRAKVEPEDRNIPKSLFLLDSRGKWVPATHPFVQYTNIPNSVDEEVIKAGGKIGLNFGLPFARKMLEANPGVAIGLVVNSKGGSVIETWKKGAKDSNYDKTMERVRPIRETGLIRGVLWHQGESDQKMGEAYVEALAPVIAQFRQDFNQPKLPFVAGQIAPQTKEKQRIDVFNRALLKLPSIVPHTGVARADDFSGNDTHFDSNETRKLGRRYAEEILKLQDKIK